MSNETRWTYVLLGGCVILILISAYILFSQGRVLASAQQRLQSTKLELAQKQAQLLVLTDALVAVEDQAKSVDEVSGKVSIICSHQRETNEEVRALCALSEWATSSSGRFVTTYAGAAAERANASSPADWKKVRSEYAALLKLLTPEVDPGHLWKARVWEGLAYSDYRLGNLDQARVEAERAYGLDRRSAFAGLTRLKIGCSAKETNSRIRDQFAALKRDLQESARNPIPPMDKTYAGYELGYFDRDAELGTVCAYANLPTPR